MHSVDYSNIKMYLERSITLSRAVSLHKLAALKFVSHAFAKVIPTALQAFQYYYLSYYRQT